LLRSVWDIFTYGIQIPSHRITFLQANSTWKFMGLYLIRTEGRAKLSPEGGPANERSGVRKLLPKTERIRLRLFFYWHWFKSGGSNSHAKNM